ncbi:MAG: sensor histidine kinase [Actinomycetota bacterium]
MNKRFAELVDLDRFRTMMRWFYQATGIPHGLLDVDDTILSAIGWQDICTKFHRVCPETACRCQVSDHYIASRLPDAGFVGYQCANGLMDYAAPVIIDGEHVATMFLGQLLHEPPDVERFRRQAAEFGFDEREYLAALERVPVIPADRVEAAMAFFAQLAGVLADAGAERLRHLEARQEVVELNRELSERVEARTRELEDKASALTRSNAELEQFAYVASHDLREPLRMIGAFVTLLEQRYGPKLDDQAREFIAFAKEGAARMDRLVLDLLDYSRIGRRGDEPSPVDSAAALETALADLSLVVIESRADVQVTTPMPMVMADPGDLARLFQNLIANAIKYTPAGRPPEIRIGCGRQDDRFWVFSIADRGIGIDPEQAERIFLIFQRLHTRQQYEGTGIGLAVCKKIVERLGGDIWVEPAEGGGSVFNFTLPAV